MLVGDKFLIAMTVFNASQAKNRKGSPLYIGRNEWSAHVARDAMRCYVEHKKEFASSSRAWRFMRLCDAWGIQAGFPSLDGSNSVRFNFRR